MPELKIKHRDEWKQLIDLCENKGLSIEHKIFLLALREVEDGVKTNEFNIKVVQGTDLERQTLLAIESIKKNDKRWQKWCIEKEKIPFVDFFAYHGGPYGSGWSCWSGSAWVDDMNYFINNIKEEFDGPTKFN